MTASFHPHTLAMERGEGLIKPGACMYRNGNPVVLDSAFAARSLEDIELEGGGLILGR